MSVDQSIVVLSDGCIENPDESSICHVTTWQAKEASIVRALCEDPYTASPPNTIESDGSLTAVPKWVDDYLPMKRHKDPLRNFIVLRRNEMEKGGHLNTKLFGVLWFDGNDRVFSYSNNGEYSFQDI